MLKVHTGVLSFLLKKGKISPIRLYTYICVYIHKLKTFKAGESESCSILTDSLWPHGLCSPWNSLGQNTGVGSLSLLQGIFPIQGSNPAFPHCRQILYQLSHKGSPLKLVTTVNLGLGREKGWVLGRCGTKWNGDFVLSISFVSNFLNHIDVFYLSQKNLNLNSCAAS